MDEAEIGASAELRDDVEFERVWLDDGSWVDLARGWLAGAGAVYDAVVERAAWQKNRLWRYERYVEEPRLTSFSRAGATPPHPVLLDAQTAIRRRYGVPFEGFAMNWYRDGRDHQALHRDRDLRWLDDTVIAILTLGARRPWHLRPRTNRYAHELPNKGATHDFAPGNGDLLVMGGQTQLGWEHGVPQAYGVTGGRVSVQWRWTSRRGKPVQGASYSAPRNFSR